MKRLLFSTIALAALITPAFATVCQTRVNDVPDIIVPGAVIDVLGPVKTVVGSTTGKDGWDGTGGQCTKPGSPVIWVGPRDAKGNCLTPASLVGTVAGPVYGTRIEKIGTEQLPDTVIVTPDDPEYRIGVQVPATKYTPSFWLGTNWKDGTCP